MAAELKEELGVEAELIRGSDGIFDIVVDGQMIFSKGKAGRFPKSGEALGLIKP